MPASDLHLQVASKMEELGASVAIGLQFKVDSYFDVVRGLVDDFAGKKGLNCIYVSASIPSSTLAGALTALEVKAESISYIDCIAHLFMGKIEPSEAVAFVESPTMLENIILKVEYFMRRGEGKQTVVVIDSMNSLALYNDSKMLSEFMAILMSALKAREAYPVVLALPDQLKPEMKEMLGLVCDQLVSFE